MIKHKYVLGHGHELVDQPKHSKKTGAEPIEGKKKLTIVQ